MDLLGKQLSFYSFGIIGKRRVSVFAVLIVFSVLFFFLIYFAHIFVHIWRPEDNFWDSGLSIITWVLGIELKLSVVMVNSVTH